MTSASGRKYMHLSTWMTKVIELWVVLQCCLARLAWTFTSKLSILLFCFCYKESYTMMLLSVCSASIRLLHEHPPFHCHLSSAVLVRRQCFGRGWFCTASYRLPRKTFKYIFPEFVNTWGKWAVNAWVCSIGPSAWVLLLTFQKQHGALYMQSKWFLSCW